MCSRLQLLNIGKIGVESLTIVQNGKLGIVQSSGEGNSWQQILTGPFTNGFAYCSLKHFHYSIDLVITPRLLYLYESPFILPSLIYICGTGICLRHQHIFDRSKFTERRGGVDHREIIWYLAASPRHGENNDCATWSRHDTLQSLSLRTLPLERHPSISHQR